MDLGNFLYSVGVAAESLGSALVHAFREIVKPTPTSNPPSFKLLKKFIKRDLSIHEFLSLKLQLMFMLYLVLNLFLLLVRLDVVYIGIVDVGYFLYIRFLILKNREFFIDPRPYRFFYYSIFVISGSAFLGYGFLRMMTTNINYLYGYLISVLLIVIGFRAYFKQRFGRDYTYGIVEEVKNDLVRVFVHDDIAANVKPGYYWVERVQDAEPGRVVKLLLEDRKLRGAVPSRILEVYLGDQSSQTSSEPKNESE